VTEPAIRSYPEGKEERILQAAVAVFARKGYHGSAIADVAREAGVAAGTIYLYFARKEDLLIELFRRSIGGYLEEVRPRLEAAAPGLPRLWLAIRANLAFFEEDRARARVLLLHAREVHPLIREGIRPVMRAYFAVLEDVLATGMAAGAFAPDLDPALARRFVAGGLEEAVARHLVAHPATSLLELHDPLFRMVARAAGADPAAVAAFADHPDPALHEHP